MNQAFRIRHCATTTSGGGTNMVSTVRKFRYGSKPSPRAERSKVQPSHEHGHRVFDEGLEGGEQLGAERAIDHPMVD